MDIVFCAGFSCAVVSALGVLWSIADGLPRRRLLPPLAAPAGRSSSLRCGRSTWTCGCAGGGMAAIEESLSLPRRACYVARGRRAIWCRRPGTGAGRAAVPCSGLVASAAAILGQRVAGVVDQVAGVIAAARPGDGHGCLPAVFGGRARGAVRTGMSHVPGTLLSGQACPVSGRGEGHGLAAGRQIVLRTAPDQGCQPILGPGPPLGSGVVQGRGSRW